MPSEIPLLSRLGYKVIKIHQIEPGVFLAMASMEIDTTYLVAIITRNTFVDSQVFFDLKSANKVYKRLKDRIYKGEIKDDTE